MKNRISNCIGMVFKKTIPFFNDALFYLDGTIIQIGGNNYFKDRTGNNRHFLITNLDFNNENNFPFKSFATISAPVADLTLIAADIHNFLYDGAGNPIQLGATSFFYDIDYFNKLFVKHNLQLIDSNNCESYKAGIKEIVLYNNVKVGADLTTCQNHFSVPAEQIANAAWLAIGGAAANPGTKLLPEDTFTNAYNDIVAGGQIYCKNGSYDQTLTILKNIILTGTGKSNAARVALYSMYVGNNSTVVFNSMIISSTSANALFTDAGAPIIVLNKCFCYCVNPVNNAIRKNSAAGGTITINDSQINGLLTEAIATTVNVNRSILKSGGNYPVTLYGGSYVFNYSKVNRGAVACFIHNANAHLTLFDCNLTGYVLNMGANMLTSNVLIQKCKIYSDVAAGVLTFLFNLQQLEITDCKIYNPNILIGSPVTLQNQTGALTKFNNNYLFNQSGSINIFTCTLAEALKNISINGTDSGLYSLDSKITITENIFKSTNSSRLILQAHSVNVGACLVKRNIIIQTVDINTALIHIGTGGVYDIADLNFLSGTIVEQNKAINYGVGSHGGINVYGKDFITVQHNYIKNTGIGIGIKAEGFSYYNTFVKYNLILNSDLLARSIWGAKYYNNTIVLRTSTANLIGIDVTWDGVHTSQDLVFKNNIIVNDGINNNVLISIGDLTSMAGFVSDYNIFYSKNPTPIWYLGGLISFAAWQALGYDTHSIMLTDAEYENLFTDFKNGDYSLKNPLSKAIGAGENLGVAHNTGFDSQTKFNNELEFPDVITKVQPAIWDCGCFIH